MTRKQWVGAISGTVIAAVLGHGCGSDERNSDDATGASGAAGIGGVAGTTSHRGGRSGQGGSPGQAGYPSQPGNAGRAGGVNQAAGAAGERGNAGQPGSAGRTGEGGRAGEGGGGGAAGATLPPWDRDAAGPLLIAGEYEDDWQTLHSISDTTWTQQSQWGTSFWQIARYDNDSRYVIAQNDSGNSFAPGLWSRFDWTTYAEAFWFCQSAYDADSASSALATGRPDDTDPAADGSCGVGTWSKLNERSAGGAGGVGGDTGTTAGEGGVAGRQSGGDGGTAGLRI